VPFDSGTTNFASQVRTLIASNPQAVYIAAGERDLRQLAPQLEYYGLTRRPIQLLGSEAWTSDEILRLVDTKYTNGVIASTPLNRASASAGGQCQPGVRTPSAGRRRVGEAPVRTARRGAGSSTG
jgi:ABC-type branched-subunit amino acid transport system substrate-binding protein